MLELQPNDYRTPEQDGPTRHSIPAAPYLTVAVGRSHAGVTDAASWLCA
jgi:hypothetical protein